MFKRRYILLNLFRKIITSSLGRRIAILVSGLLSKMNKIVPKNKSKILFYAPESDFLTDNSKALYNYLIENNYNKSYKIICCVTNTNKSKIFDIKNVKIVGLYSGIFHYLTSQYVFYSFGSMRIKASKNQKIVNLTHGTPLKSLGSFEVSKRYGNEVLNDFTYIIATSEYYKRIICKAFQCPSEKVVIQGHSRNDYLLSSKRISNLEKCEFKKKILWMPTYRVNKGRYNDLGENSIVSETGLPLLEQYKDLDEINKLLLKNNILLAIKIHPGSEFENVKYSNINLYTNSDLEEKNIELYEFVKEFDALLTDYSSIFFDYLLLDRPIGFTVDDFELYSKNRGFSVKNPLNHMPGHHIKSIEELKIYFEDVISDNDLYKAERSKVNELVNYYQDNNNRKRILDFLGIQRKGKVTI